MTNPFKTMWWLLWSVPIAAVWVVLWALLWIGWGPKTADLFITHWNDMIDADYFLRTKGHGNAGSKPTGN